MSARFHGVKGVEDILPAEARVLEKIESVFRDTVSGFGFGEMRIPIIEHTEVFARSIGETTDIVEKEMYTFADRAGRSLTLRPEGTASVVRCYVEKHLHGEPPPQKYFYMGPMFRYERPQKGRQRQFYQLGVEAFGVSEPRIDAEIISMAVLFLRRAGLERFKLEINSIGCAECRPAFRDALRNFFTPNIDTLCPDCKRRYDANPLRILDCKAEACRELKKGAPHVTDYLCPACRAHWEELKVLLGSLGVPFVHNPEMVRGLDYYTRTTFEITSDMLGSQNAVSAGGRYDRLVEEFGGPATPAIGFAVGVERLAALAGAGSSAPAPHVLIASLGIEAGRRALRMADELRAKGFWIELGYDGASLKSQLRRADRIGAGLVVIIGEDELSSGMLKWKDLRAKTSGEVPITPEEVERLIKNNANTL